MRSTFVLVTILALVWFFSDISLGGRYYDAKTGRFLTVDPKAHKGPSWSPYHFTLNNPLKYIDPDGQWPKKIHDRIIEKAFSKTFSASQISNIKFGSQEADRFQGEKHSYMHAMRAASQTKEEAQTKMNEFVKEKQGEFMKLSQSGDYVGQIKAFIQLGEAIHPIMDATSPSHEGFQVWHGMPANLKELIEEIRHGKLEDLNLSEEQIEQLAKPLKDFYNETMKKIEEVRKQKEEAEKQQTK